MVCAGYEEIAGVPDRDGNPRTAIVYRLVAAETADVVPVEPEQGSGSQDIHPTGWYWGQPLEALRQAALEPPVTTAEAKKTVQRHSPYGAQKSR